MLSSLQNDVSVVVSTRGWVYQVPYQGGVLKVADNQGVAGADKPRAPSAPAAPSKGTVSRRASLPGKIPNLVPGISSGSPSGGSGLPSQASGVGAALKSLKNVVIGGELCRSTFPSSNPEGFDGGIIPAPPKKDDSFRDFKAEMQKPGFKVDDNDYTGAKSVPVPGPPGRGIERHSIATTSLSKIARKSSVSLSSVSSTKFSQKQSERTNRCFQTLYWISKTDEKKLHLEVDTRSAESVGRLLRENNIDRSRVYISASFIPIDLISQNESSGDGAGARPKIAKEEKPGGYLTGNSLIKALKKVLTKSGLEHVDLYVLMGASPTTSLGRNFVNKWGRELYKCRKEGFARTIGVGDFSAKMLELITREIPLQYDREKEREVEGGLADCGEIKRRSSGLVQRNSGIRDTGNIPDDLISDPEKSESITGGGTLKLARTFSYDPDRPIIESHTISYSLLDRTTEQIKGLKRTSYAGGLGGRRGGEFLATADSGTYSAASDSSMGLLMFAKHPLGPSAYLSGKVPFRKVYLNMKREAEEKHRKKRNSLNPKDDVLGHTSRPDGLGATSFRPGGAVVPGGQLSVGGPLSDGGSARGDGGNQRAADSAETSGTARGVENVLNMMGKSKSIEDAPSSPRVVVTASMGTPGPVLGSTVRVNSTGSASSNSRTPLTSAARESNTNRQGGMDFDSEFESGAYDWEGDPEWVALEQLYQNLLTVILEICFDRNNRDKSREFGDGKSPGDTTTRYGMCQHSAGTDSVSDSHGQSSNPPGQYAPNAGIHLIDPELYEEFLFELEEKQRREKKAKEQATNGTKHGDNNKNSHGNPQGNSKGASLSNSRSLSRSSSKRTRVLGGEAKNRKNEPADFVQGSSQPVAGNTTRNLSTNEVKPGDLGRSSSQPLAGNTTRKLSMNEGKPGDPVRSSSQIVGGNTTRVESTGKRTSTGGASGKTPSERDMPSKTRLRDNILSLSKQEEQKRELEQKLNQISNAQSLRDNPLQLPNPLNLSIESKVFVTPAMVALSWLFSKGCIPIIATKEDRDAVENMSSAKLELTAKEMARLDAASDVFRYSMNIFDEAANNAGGDSISRVDEKSINVGRSESGRPI